MRKYRVNSHDLPCKKPGRDVEEKIWDLVPDAIDIEQVNPEWLWVFGSERDLSEHHFIVQMPVHETPLFDVTIDGGGMTVSLDRREWHREDAGRRLLVGPAQSLSLWVGHAVNARLHDAAKHIVRGQLQGLVSSGRLFCHSGEWHYD